MKKYLALGALSLAASAFLIGCGSSSSTTITETELETGYFIDAPVEGLAYRTASGLTGSTDSLENFIHNMNFKKTKGFETIKQLSPSDFG